MTDLQAYLLQRISAMVLAPLVLVHLVVIVIAVRDGLSASEILARTQGSLAWGLIYGLFVVAAAVHAGVGLRAVISETTAWRGRSLDGAMLLFGLLLLVLGLRAVAAVVL